MSRDDGCAGLAMPPVVQVPPSVFRFPQDVDRAGGAGGARLTVLPNGGCRPRELRGVHDGRAAQVVAEVHIHVDDATGPSIAHIGPVTSYRRTPTSNPPPLHNFEGRRIPRTQVLGGVINEY
ncbi:hypothetical protein ACWFRM_14260 [Streptomyces sp. NPDC055144]